VAAFAHAAIESGILRYIPLLGNKHSRIAFLMDGKLDRHGEILSKPHLRHPFRNGT